MFDGLIVLLDEKQEDVEDLGDDVASVVLALVLWFALLVLRRLGGHVLVFYFAFLSSVLLVLALVCFFRLLVLRRLGGHVLIL
eukprot:13663742-Heterocapsa_arctica.AAC.1